MADTDVLKSFLIDIGFKVDPSGLRKTQEALKQTEAQLNRFSQSTHRGTTLWNRFFQQFQRAAGPQREHIEVASRLGKAYEILGINLKTLASFVTGGSLIASFANLNRTLNDAYLTAQAAGESMKNLSSFQFGLQQVTGLAPQAAAGLMIQFMHQVSTQTGAVAALRGWGVDVQTDERGFLRNPRQAIMSLFQVIARMSQQNTPFRAIAEKIASDFGGIELPPQLQAMFRDPKLFEEAKEWMDINDRLIKSIIGDIDEVGEHQHKLSQQWNEFTTALDDVRIHVADQFVPGLTAELNKINKWFEDGMKEPNWEQLGKDAGAEFVKGLTETEISIQFYDKIVAAVKGAITGIFRGFVPEGAGVPTLPGFFAPPPGGPAPLQDPQRSVLWDQLQKLWAGQTPSGPAAPPPGAPTQDRQTVPQHQLGGIVGLHAGELILSQDTVRAMADWLRSTGSYRPFVTIDNVQDFMARDDAAPGEGGSGGGGGLRRGGAVERFGEVTHLSQASARTFQDYAQYLQTQYPKLFDQAHTEAFLANAMAESGGRPEAVGDFGTSIGLFQHHGERAQALLAYLKSRGTDIHNAFAQLDFAVQEQLKRDPGWFLPGTKTGLTSSFETGFERPAHPSGRAGYLAEMDRILGGGPPLTTTNNTWNTGGNRSLNVDNSTTVHIVGDSGLSTGGLLNSVISRQNANLLRNLEPAVR